MNNIFVPSSLASQEAHHTKHKHVYEYRYIAKLVSSPNTIRIYSAVCNDNCTTNYKNRTLYTGIYMNTTQCMCIYVYCALMWIHTNKQITNQYCEYDEHTNKRHEKKHFTNTKFGMDWCKFRNIDRMHTVRRIRTQTKGNGVLYNKTETNMIKTKTI